MTALFYASPQELGPVLMEHILYAHRQNALEMIDGNVLKCVRQAMRIHHVAYPDYHHYIVRLQHANAQSTNIVGSSFKLSLIENGGFDSLAYRVRQAIQNLEFGCGLRP